MIPIIIVNHIWKDQNMSLRSKPRLYYNYIHPALRLRALDSNSKPTEEDQGNGDDMLPTPFAHFIQTQHHTATPLMRQWKLDATGAFCTFHTKTASLMRQCAIRATAPTKSSYQLLRKGNYDVFGHAARPIGVCKKILQDTVPWQRKRREDNIIQRLDRPGLPR